MQTDERTILHHELVVSVRLHDGAKHGVRSSCAKRCLMRIQTIVIYVNPKI